MHIVDEFLSQFELQMPEDVPSEIERDYMVLSCLSKKETREVYLLRKKDTGEKAVLKIAKKTDPEDLARAHTILSGLSYAGIPKTLGYWESDENHFLLRTWAEGDTLDILVQRDGVFSQRRVLEIIQSLCQILSYLHKQNPPVIFRDIKPQNIVLTPNGNLSLIDFGIIKEVKNEEEMQTIFVGTAAFAAPEQYGFSKTGPQTDIFAIGKLMLWLTTGSTSKDARKNLKSGGFSRIVDKCTELSQKLRFSSVDALSRRIQFLLYPPKLKEMFLGFGIAAVILVVGVLWWNDALPKPEIAANEETQIMVGHGYEKEAAFNMRVSVTNGGKPFADCVVAIDNRHWYYPTEKGLAILWVHAYDLYTLRVASENRVATVPVTVNRGSTLDFSVEMEDIPVSDDLVELTASAGKAATFPLNVKKATELHLQGEPKGVSVVNENGQLRLVVDGSITPGFHNFFFEAKNEFGYATTMVSLVVEQKQSVIEIKSAEQLDQIRENLSGEYALIGDIDLSDYPDWKPIGDMSDPFLGKLDGRGHRIIGLTINNQSSQIGLFGMAKGAIFQNIIFEAPYIQADVKVFSNIGVLAGMAENCFVKNCAVFGGKIDAATGNESNIGGLCGYGSGVFLNCYNGSDIENDYPEEGAQTYTGGICGVLLGYLADSGNDGTISGLYVTGGLVGINDNSVITRCYNTGQIIGPLVNGDMAPGGITHIIRVGRYVSHCVFGKTNAEVGASVTTKGYPYQLHAVDKQVIYDSDELSELLMSSQSTHGASLDGGMIVPDGILQKSLSPPKVIQNGNNIIVSPIKDITYFYALDGSNPREMKNSANSLNITLAPEDELRIYAAKKGFYDSEIVAIKIQNDH